MNNENKYASLVGKWCLIEGPTKIEHNFTFMQEAIEIGVNPGEHRLSLWEAYLYSCHPEIKVTPLEV